MQTWLSAIASKGPQFYVAGLTNASRTLEPWLLLDALTRESVCAFDFQSQKSTRPKGQELNGLRGLQNLRRRTYPHIPCIGQLAAARSETQDCCSDRILRCKPQVPKVDFSIKEFWQQRFAPLVSQSPSKTLPGWSHLETHAQSFVEAPLSIRDSFSDLSQNVWMIAAPGAVGKSTLAREICAATKAVYLDLATAATVAGNYLVGGLVNAGLWDAWLRGDTTLLVDALDEARLRVTQTSFEDFLVDVANVAKDRSIPIVLLGRVGIVEEAWTILNDRSDLKSPIFDIGLFDTDRAKDFVMAALRRLANAEGSTIRRNTYSHLAGSLESHSSVYRDAVCYLVDHLAAATISDGRQFAGYAPVLEAVATVIASEPNPSKVGDAMKSILQGEVLGRVTSEVMDREAGKLAAQVSISYPGINTKGLYGPEEQLSRLASRVIGVGTPKIPKSLTQDAVAAYEAAVESLLPQHPFLDSKELKASGAVFGACILAAALTGQDSDLVRAAERLAMGGPNTPNPFLLEFYLKATGQQREVPAEHVGLLYASLEASGGAGDVVRLCVDGDDKLDVEMSLVQSHGGEKLHEFTTASGGVLRFGRRISGVIIDAENTDIDIGDGGQVELVSPVTIRARTLCFSCTELVVKADNAGSIDTITSLEASDVISDAALRPPVVRQGARLQVIWPDAKVYPWTPFATDASEDPDPRMADAQRALRRLCISFRSHSKGRLARCKGKVEHFRMTKGDLGVNLRNSLLSDKVITLEGEMYFLDPDALGKVVGASFQDLKIKNYSPVVREYLNAVLG